MISKNDDYTKKCQFLLAKLLFKQGFQPQSSTEEKALCLKDCRRILKDIDLSDFDQDSAKLIVKIMDNLDSKDVFFDIFDNKEVEKFLQKWFDACSSGHYKPKKTKKKKAAINTQPQHEEEEKSQNNDLPSDL